MGLLGRGWGVAADREPKENLSKHTFSLRPEQIIDQP